MSPSLDSRLRGNDAHAMDRKGGMIAPIIQPHSTAGGASPPDGFGAGHARISRDGGQTWAGEASGSVAFVGGVLE